MIDRGHALSVTKQAEAAGVARSTVYYLPRPVPAADIKVLHAKIGELTLENDFLEGALSKAGLLNARR